MTHQVRATSKPSHATAILAACDQARRWAQRVISRRDLLAAPLIVEADALRLEQVLYNLIQNAIKYSPAGGTITVAAQQEGQQAVVSVTDQGVGIPAADLPHVFERFYRATNIAQGSINGLGVKADALLTPIAEGS